MTEKRRGGAKPDRLAIPIGWEAAVGKAVLAKKPDDWAVKPRKYKRRKRKRAKR